MNTLTAIATRYSHKEKFLTNHPVPLHDLEQIAQAALAAPSGVNRQTVHLILLPNREAITPIANIAPTAGITTAPAAIAILTDTTITPQDRTNFEKEDYSAATQNILLAATALGYSSLWLDSPFFSQEAQTAAVEALGAPNHFHLWAVIPIGKPDGDGSRREKLPFAKRVSYNQYGGTK